MNLPFEVKKLQPNVHEVRFRYEAGIDTWRVLLTSDRHWDHPHSDRALQKRHLEEAQERGAPAIDLGDLFCVMQGKHDPRRNYDNLREEHAHANYLDHVVDEAVEFFAPYASHLRILGEGNHEKSVKSNANTDLGYRLALRLTQATGFEVDKTAYEGWVIFRFEHKSGGGTLTVVMYYHHGRGGSAVVTKGVIDTNRRSVMLANADIVATGHIHESWEMPLMRKHLSTRTGKEEYRQMLHVQVPTYKRESNDKSGFHIEKGRPPKPIGARWLVFERYDREIKYSSRQAH